jgi:maltooligosyltrehalose trehalohydrolase
VDHSAEHILVEMAKEVRRRFPERHIHLTIEDDDNSTRLLKFDDANRPLLFTAEWNDDWHHAVHALLTGEREGYYQDYADAPAKRIAETMATGFGYQGERSPFRGGKKRGEKSAHLPPTAFINFVQNHDQVGNRAEGERIASLVPPEAVEAALALLLLSPHIPLLYMGEECDERAPFQFFTDFKGELAEAVRKGRNEEFNNNKAFTEAFTQNLVPDPNAPETFAASRLKRTDDAKAKERTSLVKRLIAARFQHIIPVLAGIGGNAGKVEGIQGRAFAVSWKLADGGALKLSANLSDIPAHLPSEPRGKMIFAQPDAAAAASADGTLPPWSVVAAMDSGG